MSQRPMGWATTAVLRGIRQGHAFGADIMETTDLSGGSVYKILRRVERRGLVEGRWEDAGIAEEERRPRRRYYRLTPAGEVALDAALDRFRALVGNPAANS